MSIVEHQPDGKIRGEYEYRIEQLKEAFFIMFDVEDLGFEPDSQEEDIIGDDLKINIREQFPYNEFEEQRLKSEKPVIEEAVEKMREGILENHSI